MPDSSEIAMDFGLLGDLSGAISQAHGQVDSAKGDIKSSSGTLQAAWTGTGSESWQPVQAKWDAACANLLTTLNGLSVAVQQVSEAMQEQEKINAATFHQ